MQGLRVVAEAVYDLPSHPQALREGATARVQRRRGCGELAALLESASATAAAE